MRFQNIFTAAIVVAHIATAQNTPISDRAFAWINARIDENRQHFYVYKDQDSAFNRAIASGRFASSVGRREQIVVNTSCVYDSKERDGCTSSPEAFDKQRGNIIQVRLPPLNGNEFAGLFFEAPEGFAAPIEQGGFQGTGLDLTGADTLAFEAASLSGPGCQVKFGVRGSETGWLSLPTTLTKVSFPFSALNPPLRRLTGVHVLFELATDAAHCPAPGKAVILLDNIELTPVPAAQSLALGFPLANETYGILPVSHRADVAKPQPQIPPDQVNRNIAPIYESALVLLGLLNRGDRVRARFIADAFVYALDHETSGEPLRAYTDLDAVSTAPVYPDAAILHNAYAAGNLAQDDDSKMSRKHPQPPRGMKGQVRLGGFSMVDLCLDPKSCNVLPVPLQTKRDGEEPDCGEFDFCLVLDGATGGNNAFAMLALIAASRQFEEDRPDTYLRAARRIGEWIDANLLDRRPGTFGGFFLGWNDQPVVFLVGKSVENNADLYAAYRVLADRERETGDEKGLACHFDDLALKAGQFVKRMFDGNRFYAGTVPSERVLKETKLDPQGLLQGKLSDGQYEYENRFDFTDGQTFVALALLDSVDYGSDPAIDWRKPMMSVVSNEQLTVRYGGQDYVGVHVVKPDGSPDHITYPRGLSWEFTGQAVVNMKLLQQKFGDRVLFAQQITDYLNSIAKAQQLSAGAGSIIAAMVENGETLALQEQCLITPFQCIAQRPGLAATIWGAFAETGFNPLGRPAPKVMPDVCPVNSVVAP